MITQKDLAARAREMVLEGCALNISEPHHDEVVVITVAEATRVVARALAERGEWLPIESAPKDQTALAVVEVTEKNRVHTYKPTVFPVYFDEDGRVCNCETWMPDIGIAQGYFRATHYMPLPAPPSSSDPTPKPSEREVERADVVAFLEGASKQQSAAEADYDDTDGEVAPSQFAWELAQGVRNGDHIGASGKARP